MYTFFPLVQIFTPLFLTERQNLTIVNESTALVTIYKSTITLGWIRLVGLHTTKTRVAIYYTRYWLG